MPQAKKSAIRPSEEGAREPIQRWQTDGEMAGEREKIQAELARDLERATSEFMLIQAGAMEVIRNVPFGLPHPDGQLLLKQAYERVDAAFQQYQRAVKRYRDFVDEGILPDADDSSKTS